MLMTLARGACQAAPVAFCESLCSIHRSVTLSGTSPAEVWRGISLCSAGLPRSPQTGLRRIEGMHSSATASAQTAMASHEASTRPSLPPSLLLDLEAKLGDRVSTNTTALSSHGKDESYRPCIPPQAVVFPESTDEVATVRTVLCGLCRLCYGNCSWCKHQLHFYVV